MGDPKKQRKKYSTPSHPWQKVRIEEEKKHVDEFGLKNKREIWKMNSLLKNFTHQAKRLITLSTVQAEKEQKQFLKRLYSMGLISEAAKIEDVLSLTLRDVMKRRLQTKVFEKSLARSVNQARQFITHKHIRVGEYAVTSPSYIVARTEEDSIAFVPNSALGSPDHPERVAVDASEAKKKSPPKKASEERAPFRKRQDRKGWKREDRRQMRKK